VLDGDPGAGKSTVSIDIAARVSTGAPMPDGSAGAKGAVLVLSAEDGLGDTIRPRIDAAGGDPSQILAMTGMAATDEKGGEFTRQVSIPRDLPAIETVCRERRVALIIVDVLMAYLAGDVNSHHDQDVRRALHPLAGMAGRLGCCVLVIRHLNKSAGSAAIYRGGGSIGITGAARACFMCGTDPEDESRRVLAPVKVNLCAEPAALAYRLVTDDSLGCVRVDWLGASGHKAWQLLAADNDDGEQRTERDEAADWLRTWLADHGGEAAARDVIKAARGDGFQLHTVQRARRRADVETVKAGFGGGWLWRLAAPRRHEDDEGDRLRDGSPSSPSVSSSADDLDPWASPSERTNP
jgi:hypothetical protein